jgi:hypothetical protein
MIKKMTMAVASTAILLAGAAMAGEMKAPPGGDYAKVSDLVPLPEFIPGMGVLYVQPATLPAGPFLAYDKAGKLVSTIYMLPNKALADGKTFVDLSAADAPVDHVDVVHNAGHPGVDEPHLHVVLWHVDKKKAASLGGSK